MVTNFEIGDVVELKKPFTAGKIFLPTKSPFVIIDGPFKRLTGDIQWEILLFNSFQLLISEDYFLI